jgi:signal transduction histidine kinase/CheY-like chemotaxis protein
MNSIANPHLKLVTQFYRIVMAVALVFLFLGVPFVFARKLASGTALSIAIAVILYCWHLARSGYVERSLKLCAWVIWLIVVVLIFLGQAPIFMGLLLALAVLLAVVVGRKTGLTYGIAYLSAWLLYIVLDQHGLAPPRYFQGTAATQWVITALAFWVTFLPISSLVADLRNTVTQVQSEAQRRAEVESQLRIAIQIAEQASLTKSQFLANMSHEIRTPMNAILGMLTLLRKTELTTRQADYAAKSDGAARALLGLLNEILDFSKIEAGKMTLDPHPFSVDQVLRDLSVILSANLGQKPVEVLFEIDPLLPGQLVGDAMRLQQVLLNLGSNAIKFTERGEVVLALKIMQRTDDAVTLQFSMRDSGIGIAPENQARIFSGFTQAESSTTRRFGGTGLGIVISQRFVGMMGGELELQSELGKGSRFFFTVTLPIAAESDQQERESMLARADSASWRALVIDDNPTAREVLEHMGQSLGWKIDLADNGAQALQMLEQRKTQGINYQAIFVDWSMPDMDGWQTSQHIRALQAQQIKADDATVAPVIVMVTAHGREMLSQRSAADQALLDGFLVKPITTSMLFDAVIDARAGHVQPHPSRVAAQASQHRLEGMRLLLVEDNLNNQQVARELLEDEGALVQIANHGQEAVEAIAAAAAALDSTNSATQPFDVVLMDLQMPVMDGFAATRAIRRDLGLNTLPIVAMTANAMVSDREACLAVGMNDHVGKPFDINDLVRVLRRQAQWGDALVEPTSKDATLTPGVLQAAAAGAVDIKASLHRLGGKQDVYRRMLQTFVNDLQAMPEQLQALTKEPAAAATPDAAMRVLPERVNDFASPLNIYLLSSV